MITERKQTDKEMISEGRGSKEKDCKRFDRDCLIYVHIRWKRLCLRNGGQGRIRGHGGIDSLEKETPGMKFQVGMNL